jgi:L-seryl-tRNA(Ser) seleniumtransferase
MTQVSTRGQVYRRFGAHPIINAAGTVTRLGGSRTRPEAIAAMAEATNYMVDMLELNSRAGDVIARVTGAEAGFVCNGAASGLLLQAAAVIAGTNPAIAQQLPHPEGVPNEIIIQTLHRFPYDQAYRAAGAKLVTIGTGRRCAPWELEVAINERTAAVAYLFSPFIARTGLSLPQVAEIAHARGVPVIVDGASMVPPKSNLRRYIEMGADLVTISGGKGIRGPQGSGLLFGRKDLVDGAAFNASPNQFLGRGMKVSKEEIIGFLTALELFVEEDEEQKMSDLRKKARHIVDALIEIPGLEVSVEQDSNDYLMPTAVLKFGSDWNGPAKDDFMAALEEGDPPVFLQGSFVPEDVMAVDPFNVSEEEIPVLINRLREELLRRIS